MTKTLTLIPVEVPKEMNLQEIIVNDLFIIGRDASCDLTLNDNNISRRHTKLCLKENSYYIEDLKSSNGTFINGIQISNQIINPNDQIMIGPFRFSALLTEQTTPEKVQNKQSSSADEMVKIKAKIHEQLLSHMDLKKLNLEGNKEELRVKTTEAVEKVLNEITLPENIEREQIVKQVIDEALGLGPLEGFLADDDISEIMVNNKDQIYIEKKGKLVLSDQRFVSEAQVKSIIERIVSPLGRRIDESTPLVDARLADGSRVNAIIPPLALKGCSLTIRKFSKTPFQIQDLINFGSMSESMASFLKIAVSQRKNIVISGGTGSGKTTLLNVVSSFIPDDERIVTVEDAAELKLPQEHVVSLESRPPNIEGKGAILIRDLVKNCLRMRPDRIVVGECRGAEALDMLQAMNTGHDGSLTTGHANTPRDMIARLETMVLMAGMDLPSRAIREQIASAVALIVQQSRFPDGSRRVTHITEITGMENNVITMQDIFVYKQTGYTNEGKVQGYYTATGCVPVFIEELRSRGIKVDMSLYEPSKGE